MSKEIIHSPYYLEQSRTASEYVEAAPEQGVLSAEGSLGSATNLRWLAEDYAVTAQALRDLDFDDAQLDKMLRPLEQIRDTLQPHAVWLDRERESGNRHELIVSPLIQHIGLIGTRHEPGLVPRFDSKKNDRNSVTYVSQKLWGQFGDTDRLHDNGATETAKTVILLFDKIVPPPVKNREGMDSALPVVDGLAYRDLSVAAQREAFVDEKQLHALEGRNLQEATVGQYLVASAKRRLRGELPLDMGTKTRFIHYPDTYVGSVGRFLGVDYVPAANYFCGLVDSGVKYGWPDAGIRRVVDITPDAQESRQI